MACTDHQYGVVICGINHGSEALELHVLVPVVICGEDTRIAWVKVCVTANPWQGSL